MSWVMSTNSTEQAGALGIGVQEIVEACESPDWTYESVLYQGSYVAIGGRVQVHHDRNNQIILGVSWRWRNDLDG